MLEVDLACGLLTKRTVDAVQMQLVGLQVIKIEALTHSVVASTYPYGPEMLRILQCLQSTAVFTVFVDKATSSYCRADLATAASDGG